MEGAGYVLLLWRGPPPSAYTSYQSRESCPAAQAQARLPRPEGCLPCAPALACPRRVDSSLPRAQDPSCAEERCQGITALAPGADADSSPQGLQGTEVVSLLREPLGFCSAFFSWRWSCGSTPGAVGTQVCALPYLLLEAMPYPHRAPGSPARPPVSPSAPPTPQTSALPRAVRSRCHVGGRLARAGFAEEGSTIFYVKFQKPNPNRFPGRVFGSYRWINYTLPPILNPSRMGSQYATGL